VQSMSAAGPLESERLQLWERAASVGAHGRADALLRHVGELPKSLGACNTALLGLRARLFGAVWPLRSDCPKCGCTCEFVVDSARLSAEISSQLSQSAAAEHELQIDGVRICFRLPDAEDLRAIHECASVEGALKTLLNRCIVHPRVEQLSERARAMVSQRMEALEPAASLSFEVSCADCGNRWSASIDVAQALWSELQVFAEGTLLEVDALARAYGWSESQVLALSATRRAAYLQLVGAA
jgi:hypothetical protein